MSTQGPLGSGLGRVGSGVDVADEFKKASVMRGGTCIGGIGVCSGTVR